MFTILEKRSGAKLEIVLNAPEPAELFVSSPIIRNRVVEGTKAPVFLLLHDTVRHDTFSPFNPQTSIGAAISELSRDGIVFTKVRSCSSWTRSAVSTLLTGTSPFRHKVLGRLDALDPIFLTLPEILQTKGYVTYAWSTNPNVLPMWGFAKGFDVFEDVGAKNWNKHKTDGQELMQRVEAEISRGDLGQPAFYYIHLMDAHAPYEPSLDQLDRLTDFPEIRRTFPGPDTSDHKAWSMYRRYSAENLDLDEQLRRFVAFLKKHALYNRSVILVVSDHGEEFQEHGSFFHGHTLYEEVLQVPVVLKLPGNELAGTRVDRPVAFSDLMPTLLVAAGLHPPEGLDGRSILTKERTGVVVSALDSMVPQLSTLELDGRRLSAIVHNEWKLIVDYVNNEETLYDLRRDPDETDDLIATDAHRAGKLRAVLDGVRNRFEQGFHLLACGDDRQRTLRLSLWAPAYSVRGHMLEEDDRIVKMESGGGLEINLVLAPHRNKPKFLWGVVLETVPDRDALILTHGARELTANNVAILSSVDATNFTYMLGGNTKAATATEINLVAAIPSATIRTGEPIGCLSNNDPARPDHEYFRIAFVAPTDPLEQSAVNRTVLERLRALGYLW